MSEPPIEPVKYVDTHIHLPYHYVAGDARAQYLRALKDKAALAAVGKGSAVNSRGSSRSLLPEIKGMVTTNRLPRSTELSALMLPP